MQVSPIKHKTKMHIAYTAWEVKKFTQAFVACFLLHISSSSSKLQDKSRKTNCKGLEQNTGLGFHSKIKPCFFYYKMEAKKKKNQ